MNLIARFKAWREKRYWEKRQLEFLRTMIQQDVRWLSLHPISKELTERYLKAVSPDYYKLEHEEISKFRLRIMPDWPISGKPPRRFPGK